MSVGHKRRTAKRGSNRTWESTINKILSSFDVQNSTSHQILHGRANKAGESSNPYAQHEISDCGETVETHLIPRQSLTEKLDLARNVKPLTAVKLHPCRVFVKEGEVIKQRLILRRDRTFDVKASDFKERQIVKRSDKTLLIRGNPFQDPWESSSPSKILRRQESRRKQIKSDPENTYGQIERDRGKGYEVED